MGCAVTESQEKGGLPTFSTLKETWSGNRNPSNNWNSVVEQNLNILGEFLPPALLLKTPPSLFLSSPDQEGFPLLKVDAGWGHQSYRRKPIINMLTNQDSETGKGTG